MLHDLAAHTAPLLDPAVSRQLIAGQARFLAYLRRRLSSPQEAEDVLQDFSLKVIRGARSIGRTETINAWLAQILRHTLIDHYRRRAVRLRYDAAYVEEARIATPPAETDATPGRCPSLHAAVRRLRPDHAAILRRADLDDQPRARMAEDLGLTTNALNVRLHRARTALRRELQAVCPACREGCFHDCPVG